MSVDALTRPAVTCLQDLENLIRTGDYAVVSACKSHLDPAENMQRHLEMVLTLRDELGYLEYYQVRGMYDGMEEMSVLIPHMSRDDAVKLGKLYQQESVLIGSEGLVYVDSGDVVPPTGRVSINGDETDYYSVVTLPNGEVLKFAVELAF